MPVEQFANNASSPLNGDILAGATSLVVTSAASFPSVPQFRILVESELMLVTGVAGTTFTVTRGVEGTTPAGHLSGVQVTHIVTSEALLTLPQVPAGHVAKGFLRRDAVNGAWEEKLPETLLNDAAAAINVNNQQITGLGAPTPATASAATAVYAESVGVNSVNRAFYLLLTDTWTTGLTLPASIPDALMTGYSAGGGVAGVGTPGIVAGAFANVTNETGTAAGQAGLGSAPAAGQPYNPTDFAGQHEIHTLMFKVDGTPVLVQDMLAVPPVGDGGQQVECYLSYRSDLGANLKWRLWYYYRRSADGIDVSFTPTISITDVDLYLVQVGTFGTLPVTSTLGKLTASSSVVGVTPGTLADIQNVGVAAAAGVSGRFSDAQHVHAHGTIPGSYLAGLAHDLATPSINGFLSAADKTKLDTLPSIVQTVFTEIAADTTTTSAVFVNLLSQAITIAAGSAVIIHFDASATNKTNNRNIDFQLTIDGVAVRGTSLNYATGTASAALTYRATGLAAGARTIAVQWRVSGNTGQIRPVTTVTEHASLLLEEVKV